MGLTKGRLKHIESPNNDRAKLFHNPSDSGELGILIGLHLLRQGATALSDVAIRKLLVRFRKEFGVFFGDLNKDEQNFGNL
ncbi:hypothetical protein VNO78_02242 [Psophocarpus tetragonolobus]|uniref:Uncharacterized protein n=1 Tax=Psophocarpus tetragonolobus TaxID=3891 RepID=A0AAN9TAB1_PSOTE